MNKEEFKQTLVEVRRAYRLLYLYQRRTLDLIDFIGNEMSFTFNGGHSKFSNASGTKSNVKLTAYVNNKPVKKRFKAIRSKKSHRLDNKIRQWNPK